MNPRVGLGAALHPREQENRRAYALLERRTAARTQRRSPSDSIDVESLQLFAAVSFTHWRRWLELLHAEGVRPLALPSWTAGGEEGSRTSRRPGTGRFVDLLGVGEDRRCPLLRRLPHLAEIGQIAGNREPGQPTARRAMLQLKSRMAEVRLTLVTAAS